MNASPYASKCAKANPEKMTRNSSMKLAMRGKQWVITAIMCVIAGIFLQNLSIFIQVITQLTERMLMNWRIQNAASS